MVGNLLVPPAAVNNANGITGINDRNCAGLKTKQGPSFGAGNALFASFLLKSDSLQDASSGRGENQGVLKAKRSRDEKHQAVSNAMSARNHPLLESISKLANGNGSHKPMPIFSEGQIADIAQYFYLSWLSKRRPEDGLVKAELEAYSADYVDALITIKGKFMNRGGKEQEFIAEARKMAIAASEKLISLRQGFEEKAASLDKAKEERLKELERQRQACEKWVEELYGARKELISGWLSGKLMPLDDFIKALKKIWGVGKVCLPIAGALMMGSHFLSQLKDIVMRIPFVSQLTPEIAGAGLVGLWLLAKVGKVALDWHLKIVKSKLPKKAEKRKQAEMARIARATGEATDRHIDGVNTLRKEFEGDKQAVLESLKEGYRGLMRSHGYAAPSPPLVQSPFFDGMGVN